MQHKGSYCVGAFDPGSAGITTSRARSHERNLPALRHGHPRALQPLLKALKPLFAAHGLWCWAEPAQQPQQPRLGLLARLLVIRREIVNQHIPLSRQPASDVVAPAIIQRGDDIRHVRIIGAARRDHIRRCTPPGSARLPPGLAIRIGTGASDSNSVRLMPCSQFRESIRLDSSFFGRKALDGVARRVEVSDIAQAPVSSRDRFLTHLDLSVALLRLPSQSILKSLKASTWHPLSSSTYFFSMYPFLPSAIATAKYSWESAASPVTESLSGKSTRLIVSKQ